MIELAYSESGIEWMSVSRRLPKGNYFFIIVNTVPKTDFISIDIELIVRK